MLCVDPAALPHQLTAAKVRVDCRVQRIVRITRDEIGELPGCFEGDPTWSRHSRILLHCDVAALMALAGVMCACLSFIATISNAMCVPEGRADRANNNIPRATYHLHVLLVAVSAIVRPF